jgi:hypothetical protein
MATFEEQLLRAVSGRHPLVYLHTSEEERATGRLAALLPRCFAGGTITTWSCVRGLEPAPQGVDTRDPVAALNYITAHPPRGFCVMKDMSAFMDDMRVVRALREAYFALVRDYRCALVLVSPVMVMSDYLQNELFYAELEMPSSEELLAGLAAVEKRFPGASLSPATRSKAVLALRGLTSNEVDHVLARVFSTGSPEARVIDEIFAEKQTLARRAGFLEFVPLKVDAGAVGGQDNVKDWALKRKDLFTQEAVKAGLPIPKGVLIMGVSGCGKSLLAKAIAGVWQVPLFRLNMSLIFSGLYGSPEAAFNKAMRTVEGIAPLVLWIDEMESGFSSPKEASSEQAMTFSAFLTWMQEKPPLVFVAATANKIELLPAEITRKGRFDQVFFCDLPNDEERAQIIGIHLAKNHLDPAKFDIQRLLPSTDGWTGAELEQAVISALVETRQAGRPMATEDIWRQTHNMVPLSKTMEEQVNAIRDWAFKRATPASSKRYFKRSA